MEHHRCSWEDMEKHNTPWHLGDELQPSEAKLRSFHPGWPEKTKYVKIEMSAVWLQVCSAPWVTSFGAPDGSWGPTHQHAKCRKSI